MRPLAFSLPHEPAMPSIESHAERGDVLRLFTCLGLCCVLALGSGVRVSASAQQPSTTAAEAIHTVTHIDFMPSKLGAEAALAPYLAEARRDPNVVRIELLQSLSAPNHFTLLETLRNMAAYNAQGEAAYTRRFRFAIQDALGSPYDERLFHEYTPR